MQFRWAGLLLAILIGYVMFAVINRPSPLPPATQAAATSPTTTSRPTTDPVPAPPVTLFQLLKREQPAVPATQPLGVPLDLGDADHVVFNHPIFLDEVGHLWVTLPEAADVANVIKSLAGSNARGESTHLVRQRVRYVFWQNFAGKTSPNVIFEDTEGSLAIATPKGVLPIAAKRPFDFSRTFSLPDSIAIPCADGVSVLTLGDTVTEQFQPLPPGKDSLDRPQLIQGAHGLLAWSPATPTHAGSGVARYLDHAWKMLDPNDWPTSIIQLTPFLDGTVQQLRQADGEKVELASIVLDATAVDQKRIEVLVDQLGELSEDVRNKASAELERMGPSAWPMLQKLSNDQLPEVQQRLAILLAGVTAPTIGPMSLADGKITVTQRFDNGGVLIYADAGVTIPLVDQPDPAVVVPAWISIQPDRPPELLPELLMADWQRGQSSLWPSGDDWYRTDAVQGPRRFVGNAMLPLLRKSERKYCQPIGADRRGRWLFRQPGKEAPTLLIDPTIADPTPRLPVWTIRLKAGGAGWTKDGWPAIKRGGVWSLHEDGWQALDETKDPLITSVVTPAADHPSDDIPPSTEPATQPTRPPLLTAADGTTYRGGKIALIVKTPAGSTTTWILPPIATGEDPVTLIRVPDNKLFLFNQAGRVLRIAPTPGQAEPFKLEATFSRNIPSMACTRIWLDPAGRICMIYDTNLAILFPSGAIPHEIAVKMTVEELKANDPE